MSRVSRMYFGMSPSASPEVFRPSCNNTKLEINKYTNTQILEMHKCTKWENGKLN